MYQNLKKVILTIVFLSISTFAQISGGNFTIEQNVIAGGGNTNGADGNFQVEFSIGQPAAGTRPNVSSFNMQNGFWTSAPLAPTIAQVTIGGRVMTADGRGIRNVFLTLIEANGTSRTVKSSSFGYYRFVNVFAEQTFIISAKSKRFNFTQPTQIISVNEDNYEINFVVYDK